MACGVTRSAGLFASAAAVLLGFAAFNSFGSAAFAPPGSFGASNFAFNNFGAPAFVSHSFARTPFGNFNTNRAFAESPAGTFAFTTRSGVGASGRLTTTARESFQSNFGTSAITTRESFNPVTGTSAFHTHESFMPTGFNAAFASPWSSSFSTVQNPWLQRVNQYGMSGNPWGTMNSWSTSPFGSWMSNPYFAANAFTGNPWAFSGAPAFPYATPFAYGTAIAPTFGASPGFTVALMSHSQLCLRAITVDITLRVMGGCRCTHHAERDVYGNHAM